MRRTVVVLVAALTAACATASTGADGPSAPSAAQTPSATASLPPVPGIEVEVIRHRTDEVAGRQVHVRVIATGDSGFTVTSLRLEPTGFEPVPAAAVTAEFSPGRAIDLRAAYGEPRCDVPAGEAAVRLTVVRPDGAVEEVLAPAEAEVLGRIHEEECAVLALAEIVDVAVTDLRHSGTELHGSITLTRRSGAEPVGVRRLDRSVLVRPTAPELPVELGGSERTMSTPVSFALASCDPHVLADTKKPFVFPLEVVVGGDERVVMDLPIDAATRAELAALVERVC